MMIPCLVVALGVRGIVVDAAVVGDELGVFEALQILERTKPYFWHFEREGGAILDGVEFRLCHNDYHFLEYGLNAAHFFFE